ncbi:histidine phosphatase superfamily (branch 1) domain-containing protein [Ditylenchus destructor]|nr:histidine phosphatase superfamily (branch 1) domain-containing protein [Ditylenchus destructor]
MDNSPLSELGENQAIDVANCMLVVDINHAYSSPYRRTVQTAAEILAGRNPKPKLHIEPGLIESAQVILNDFPSINFESNEALEKQFPDLIDLSYEPAYQGVLPGEVGVLGCRDRVAGTMAHILRQCESGNILIVAHKSSLAAIHAYLCPDEKPIHSGQATITKYTERFPFKGKFKCEYKCDSSHLAPEHQRDLRGLSKRKDSY